MESLYDILKAGTRLPGAYENQASYRAALTRFILRHTEKGAVLHIAGAGYCSDIDVNALAEHAGTLILSDIDMDAMREGLQRQGVTVPVRLVKADYLGIRESEYRALDVSVQTLIGRGVAGKESETFFLGRMEALLEKAVPDTLPGADTVVASGVHSQLLSMFPRMASVYARYAGWDLTGIFSRVKTYNGRFMPAFTAALYASARSRLVVGLEKERMGMAGGVEGAFEALENLRSYPVREETELVWPLDLSQNKFYRMNVSGIIRQ